MPPKFYSLLMNRKGKEKRRKITQESSDTRYAREEREYFVLTNTANITVLDGFVSFCAHFKYLGTWVSFLLRDDFYIAKCLDAASAAMGALNLLWDKEQVETYSKYLMFWAIP